MRLATLLLYEYLSSFDSVVCVERLRVVMPQLQGGAWESGGRSRQILDRLAMLLDWRGIRSEWRLYLKCSTTPHLCVVGVCDRGGLESIARIPGKCLSETNTGGHLTWGQKRYFSCLVANIILGPLAI